MVPSLRVLDGERFDPKFLQIKAKRAEHKEVVEKMKQKKEDLEKKKTLKKIKRGEIQAEDVDQEVLEGADQFERKKKKSKSEKEEKKARKEEKKKRKEEKAAKKSKGEGVSDDEEKDEKRVKKSKKDVPSSMDQEDRKSKKRSRDAGDESAETAAAVGPRKKSTLSSVFKGNGPRPLAALAPPTTSDADGDVEMDDAEAKAAKAELNRVRKETRKAAKKEAKKEKAAELMLKKKTARSSKEVKEPTTLEEDGFFSKPTEEEVKTKKAKIEKAIAAATPAPAPKVETPKVEVAPARVLDPAEAAKARSGVVAVVDKSAQLAKKNKKPKFDISALEETSDAFGGGQVSGWD